MSRTKIHTLLILCFHIRIFYAIYTLNVPKITYSIIYITIFLEYILLVKFEKENTPYISDSLNFK